jgi:hypothetical protein
MRDEFFNKSVQKLVEKRSVVGVTSRTSISLHGLHHRSAANCAERLGTGERLGSKPENIIEIREGVSHIQYHLVVGRTR